MENVIITTSIIHEEKDIISIRHTAKKIAEMLEFDPQDQTRIATSVSEIARNAYIYAKNAKVTYYIENISDKLAYLITLMDKGPGIKDLNAVLSGTQKSKKGLGLGIIGSKNLMDFFEIDSKVDKGTTVTLGKYIDKKVVLSKEKINEITSVLQKTISHNPYEEVFLQNQELVKVLYKMNEQNIELLMLNTELKKTNANLVTLHAELKETNKNILSLHEELRQKEEELISQNETLKANEDILIAKNIELEKVQDELVKAHQHKNRFIASMNHELRTPLNAIIGFSQSLEKQYFGRLNEKQLEYVLTILKSGEHLLNLINEIINIAKIESGKVDVSLKKITPETFIEEVANLMKDQFEKKGVSLFQKMQSNLPEFEGDLKLCRQIMLNLLSNALKYTPEGGNVDIIVEQFSGNYLKFSVKDTGTGIKANDISKVFEEFYQADKERDEKLGGTGIGLALTKKLVELHQGKIGLESELNKGSNFWFILPLTRIMHKFSKKIPPCYCNN